MDIKFRVQVNFEEPNGMLIENNPGPLQQAPPLPYHARRTTRTMLVPAEISEPERIPG